MALRGIMVCLIASIFVRNVEGLCISFIVFCKRVTSICLLKIEEDIASSSLFLLIIINLCGLVIRKLVGRQEGNSAAFCIVAIAIFVQFCKASFRPVVKRLFILAGICFYTVFVKCIVTIPSGQSSVMESDGDGISLVVNIQHRRPVATDGFIL